MELWIRRRERERETGKEPEKLGGLKLLRKMNLGLAVWEWQEDGADKKGMQPCRCGRSGTGCAET